LSALSWHPRIVVVVVGGVGACGDYAVHGIDEDVALVVERYQLVNERHAVFVVAVAYVVVRCHRGLAAELKGGTTMGGHCSYVSNTWG
jgi:hypothetical protein